MTDTGVDWNAIGNLVNQGYVANPDGTITSPTGQTLAGSTGGTWSTPISGRSERRTDDTRDTRDTRDARRRSAGGITSLLEQYRLGDLTRYVDQWVRDGLSWSEIEVLLYDPKTAPGKIVDEIYPELRLRREAGLDPVSIAEVQEYRTRATAVMRRNGMPAGFYDDPSDFTDFIVRGVDVEEIEERVSGYIALATTAPAEVLASMKRLYKVGPEALAAYWMDPDRALPALEKQVNAATTAGSAVRAGFGNLTRAEAERLASVGVTGDQAVDAFGKLVQAGELFDDLPGSVDGTVTRREQLDLLAGDADTSRKVQQRAAARAAATQGGGGFATSREGLAGFGSSK